MLITSLELKTVTTKYGPKNKWVVKTDDGKVFDSFIGSWNQDWKVGMPLSIEPEQWQTREYQGKNYYTVNQPAGAGNIRHAANAPSQPAPALSPEVIEALRKIYQLIEKTHEEVMEALGATHTTKKEPEPKSDIPTIGVEDGEKELRLEDVHF